MADITPKTSKNKLHRLKYSCEEIYERMDNGLCIFCDELDTPGHHNLKHKGVQIFMVECGDDQVSDDKEEAHQVHETVKKSNPFIEPMENASVFQDSGYVYDILPAHKVDLSVKEVEIMPQRSTSVNDKNIEHHLFDQIPLRVTSKEKQRKCLKAWKFKFKTSLKRSKSMGDELSLGEETILFHKDPREMIWDCVNKEFKETMAVRGRKRIERSKLHENKTSKVANYDEIIQVPISSLEPSHRCQNESLDVVDYLSYAIVRTHISHSQPGGVFNEHDMWNKAEKCYNHGTLMRLMQQLSSMWWQGIKSRELDRLASCSFVDIKAWQELCSCEYRIHRLLFGYYVFEMRVLSSLKERCVISKMDTCIMLFWKQLDSLLWFVYGKKLLDAGQKMQPRLIYDEEKNELTNIKCKMKLRKNSEDMRQFIFGDKKRFKRKRTQLRMMRRSHRSWLLSKVRKMEVLRRIKQLKGSMKRKLCKNWRFKYKLNSWCNEVICLRRKSNYEKLQRASEHMRCELVKFQNTHDMKSANLEDNEGYDFQRELKLRVAHGYLMRKQLTWYMLLWNKKISMRVYEEDSWLFMRIILKDEMMLQECCWFVPPFGLFNGLNVAVVAAIFTQSCLQSRGQVKLSLVIGFQRMEKLSPSHIHADHILVILSFDGDIMKFKDIMSKVLCPTEFERESETLRQSFDRLKKLTTAIDVSQRYMDLVYKLQGTPHDIFSDRDPMFLKELFHVDGDGNVMKLRATGFHSTSLWLFYGSLPQPLDFRESSYAVIDKKHKEERRVLCLSSATTLT